MRNKVIGYSQKYLPDFSPSIVFDVGANVGQSALEFSGAWPVAKIFAFEPVEASFGELQQNVAETPNVSCHKIALSDREGMGVITSNGTSTGNRLVAGVARGKTEPVHILTGDQFCNDQRIDSVDFLKIDAEGSDLQVLVGFANLLRNRGCRLVQVETGLSPENNRHASLSQVSDFLFPFGYRIFGFFGIARHLGSKLRRNGAMFCDTVYIREDLM